MRDALTRTVADLNDEMIALRRQLHRRPELAMQEHETAALIAAKLRSEGLGVSEGVGGTGVVGLVRGKRRGKCIGLRADMDALPIREETGLPFASEVPGVMHACGHDCHVAMVWAAGVALHRQRERLRGTVKLVFQPAEETVSGAAGMIAGGVLGNPKVDAAIAVHVWKEPVGTISLRYGEHLAAADGFDIVVRGKGGHGAMPHLAADPVLAAANVVLALQQIVARRLDPVRPAVVSVCRIHGGSAFNIIPGEVTLRGTARTFGGETQDLVEAQLKRVARDAAKAYGCTARVKYTRSSPALVHNEALTRLAEETCREVLGKENVRLEPDPCMGSEDFAFFAERVPATQVAVGVAPAGGPVPVFHSAKFAPDERGLEVGARAMASVAWRFLNGKQRD
ncbi:MAG: amidohydrolase [Armatimonadetes bacterium]|nr:amidohydrolase [Armatimonadota bacterium]